MNMAQLSINFSDVGVSQNGGIFKWIIYKGKPIKMDDIGVPLFQETPFSDKKNGDLKWKLGILLWPTKYLDVMGMAWE